MSLTRIKKSLSLIITSAIAILSLKFFTLAPTHSPQNINSIRGVWLSHVGNAFLSYTTLTDNAFSQLSRLNYNRVYLDVYNGGTTYASKYAPRNYLLSFPVFNPFKTAIKEAKRQGLKIYAWYEHGMMTFPNDRLAQLHPDWILTTNNGEKLIDRHWWLDPENPEVQQYFVDLFTEAAQSYPNLDGIQVDDHWGIPIQFGNKVEAMTELTNKVVTEIRKVRPDLIISLSPNPLGFSYKKYSQDWLTWVKLGLIDELVMQIYRQTSPEVTAAIDNSLLSEVSKSIPVAVGIYTGGLDKQKPLAEINKQISVVKQYGYGYSLFCWESSLGIVRLANRQEKEDFLKAS